MFRHIGFGCCVCLFLVATGCDVSDPNAKQRQVLNPPGIAPIGMDPMDGGRAAPVNPGPAVQQPPVAQQPMAAPPANDGKGIIGKSTGEVLDAQVAMAEHPDWTLIDNKVKGDDPLTFAAQAYISARSEASMLGFKAWIKQHKIVEERNPTYAEFIQAMRENHVQFTARPPWQHYAYDAKEGMLVIMEDGAMKAGRYNAAGIPNQ